MLASERLTREKFEQEREELLARETSAREEAQRMNDAKDSFLAIFSHELRNPLAGIAGAVALLKRREDSDSATTRYVSVIDRQTKRLVHVVNDTIDVSRAVAGKIELDMKPLNLAQCVDAVVQKVHTAERGRANLLVAECADAWVNGDRLRMEQIVYNLITNAVKFSPDGSEITVSISVSQHEANIEVCDSGMGIDDAHLDRIFEPFVQGPTFKSGLPAGLGIGLALVKRLVQLHGGTVVARSRGNGLGSAFLVAFPLLQQ